MTSSVWLGYNNAACSVPVASSGCTNPQNLDSNVIAAKCRTTASAYVDLTFAASSTVRMIGLAGVVVGTGTATAKFEFSNTISGGSEVLSVTKTISLTTGYDKQGWILDANITATYLRVTFTNVAQVGLVWASPAWNPARGISYGAGDEWSDPRSVNVRSSISGARSPIRRPKSRIVTFGLEAIDRTERATAKEIDRLSGTTEQVFFMPGNGFGSDPNTEMIIGPIVETSPILITSHALCSKAYKIEQDL